MSKNWALSSYTKHFEQIVQNKSYNIPRVGCRHLGLLVECGTNLFQFNVSVYSRLYPTLVRIYRFTSVNSAAKTAFSSRKFVKRQPFCSLFVSLSAPISAKRRMLYFSWFSLLNLYPETDSNCHCHVPETCASANWAIRADQFLCTPSGIRTHTCRILGPVPLPIGLPGQII